MNQDGGNNRPEVLNNVSETQIQELERQFAENDSQAWKALTGSYGWSDSDSQSVWKWFGERPSEGSSGASQGSGSAETLSSSQGTGSSEGSGEQF